MSFVLQTTDDGSMTLFSTTFQEIYHSRRGAIQESKHVFIEAGLKFVATQHKEIKILEVGFGTGLNAFLTALYAQENQLKVNYTGLEPIPITTEIWQKLNYSSCLELNEKENEIFEKLHTSQWNRIEEINAHFFIKKIESKLEDYSTENKFDLIYFDAFAPSKQSELWELSIFEKLSQMLNSQGVLVTYCAKGDLKRNLKSVGFKVESLQGPVGKREMTRAIIQN
jgi:tRNA U34 5-methylaminomethyl-2-thiouridine-forming methyltransferase MnmC